MINGEFDFWGVKGAVLGVTKVHTTSRNVYMVVIYHNKAIKHFYIIFSTPAQHIRWTYTQC